MKIEVKDHNNEMENYWFGEWMDQYKSNKELKTENKNLIKENKVYLFLIGVISAVALVSSVIYVNRINNIQSEYQEQIDYMNDEYQYLEGNDERTYQQYREAYHDLKWFCLNHAESDAETRTCDEWGMYD